MVTFTPTVELFVDGAWLDITRIDNDTRVLARESGAHAITIMRGTLGGVGHVIPTMVEFQYMDNNSTLDGENPASPYYRKIGLGTPMRVSVDGEVRAVVELSRWDAVPSGPAAAHVIVAVEGTGILLRLEGSDRQKPLRSVAYRALTAPENDSNRVLYAPLEEESGASMLATFNRVGSIVTGNEVSIGADGDSASSERLLTFGTNGFLEVVLPFYESTEHRIISLWRLPSGGLTNGHVLIGLHCAGGNIDRINLRYNTPWLLAVDGLLAGALVANGTAAADWVNFLSNEQEVFLSLELTQDGADVDVAVRMVRKTTGSVGITTAVQTGTMSGVTIGRITGMTVGVNDIAGASFGQLAVGNSVSAFGNYLNTGGCFGFNGEQAEIRAFRLASEAGYTLGVRQATSNDSERMASQETGTLGNLLTGTVEADMGMLVEHRTSTALIFVSRFTLYNQPPDCTLRWGHLQPGFGPVRDNQRVTNDVTVSRDGGGVARYAIPDGDYWHWSTQDPPDGAGLRDSQADLALYRDDQLLPQAAWRAHVASWRERRFPSVPLELARDAFTADDRSAARRLDVGYVLVLDMTGAPSWAPYNELRLLVVGYTEMLSKFLHTITFSTVPADVYEVSYVDSGPTSVLANAIDDIDTSIKIQPGDGKPWSETGDDLPYHVQVAGQPMTVTGISTSTPSFGAVGAASYADNASVAPALPTGLANGHLMICFAARRQAGAGVIGAPPVGWTEIVASPDGNWKLFGRYWVSGDGAPTVAVSGGSAGDTVGAQVARFTNLSMALDKYAPGGYPLGYARSVNGSAQGIATPAYSGRRLYTMGIILGIKDDDWTSVAVNSGAGAQMSEVGDSSSTAGSDLGLVWDAGFDSDESDGLAAGASSFTVTGGASAVSEGVVIGLRAQQVADVVRGIAGVAVAASPGAEIRGWRMGVNAL